MAKKKFTHDRGQIILNHNNGSSTVIAMGVNPGWAKHIADNLERSESMLKMVKGA